MNDIDYYQILGVDKRAADIDIDRAYRRKFRKYKFDLDQGDPTAEEKLQQVNEAYKVLGNADRRYKYDLYGNTSETNDEPQDRFSDFKERTKEQASGFFQNIFGNGLRDQIEGEDQEGHVTIDLRDAYATHEHTILLEGKELKVTIPAGIANGQRIRLKGLGGTALFGGKKGDLFLKVYLRHDPNFERKGDDLYTKIPVDFYTALLGGELEVNTWAGRLKLKIKPETANESTLRIKGKGFPVYRHEGDFGDLYITLKIVSPSNLSEQERTLFRQLAELRKNK
jgi:curved DNA-binding protein